MSTPSLINDRYSGFDSPSLPPVVANLASGPSSRGRSYYRSFYTSIGPIFHNSALHCFQARSSAAAAMAQLKLRAQIPIARGSPCPAAR
jgi:hypothetical protein